MIICADDYGLTPDIDDSILELCSKKKLSAVSCMVALKRCGAAEMRRVQESGDLDVGLHLCFTPEPQAVESDAITAASRPFGRLLRRSLIGSMEREVVRRSIEAQYDLFVQKAGRAPDCIDGHLHTHQLSGICQALIEFVQSLPAGEQPYVRNTKMNLSRLRQAGLPVKKAAFIGFMGSRMRKSLDRAGVSTNEGFVGIYDFGRAQPFDWMLPRFVACAESATAMMVTHPGEKEGWRQAELNALRKFSFPVGEPRRLKRQGLRH